MTRRQRPQHGDYLRYLHGPDEYDTPGRPCRCERCRTAAGQQVSAYRARKVRERWGLEPSLRVDAEPVRAHVRSLMAAGIPLKTVAQLAGVGDGSVARLLYGAPHTSPPSPPTVQMTRRNAAKLLAVRAEDALALDGYVDAAGTLRRIQALVAVGWSQSEIARRIGMNPRAMCQYMESKKVHTSRARAVRDLYQELWAARPPEETGYQRRAAEAARKKAHKKRWPPPLAWDDDLIDLPEAELVAELGRRVAAMDDRELAACHTAHYRNGDISPLIVVAARECGRRRNRAVAS